MFGTVGTNPCGCSARRWNDAINALNPQRRWWESNPLTAALQAAATPCDINVSQCPCQESNLIYDLRRVACIHHTPRTISYSSFNAIATTNHKTPVIAHQKVPRRGIEPRPTASKTVMHPPHSRGRFIWKSPADDSIRHGMIPP